MKSSALATRLIVFVGCDGTPTVCAIICHGLKSPQFIEQLTEGPPVFGDEVVCQLLGNDLRHRGALYVSSALACASKFAFSTSNEWNASLRRLKFRR